eukprot:CAMPEP_0180832096 /NCGR_PEP_ID=MMETSP1038_2-20121128/76664_1 /TAXON_ID=632150 /ORGANISM="Azadinium spinosum, Strain 3D9" /LENGTH=374 /DNA_ID=CAMNT_0022875287 /DNA_START=145 /DNA_END=1266 /DNA_ORIENTATION=+
MIFLLTAVLSDLSELFGCVLGVPDSVTAISFVALGTSMPDLFASLSAAREDETADASIVNVTGSNSVNVFLGLGLPWTMGAVYWKFKGRTPKWETDYADIADRKVIGAELGGALKPKVATSCTFAGLWFMYIALVSWHAIRGEVCPDLEWALVFLGCAALVVMLVSWSITAITLEGRAMWRRGHAVMTRKKTSRRRRAGSKDFDWATDGQSSKGSESPFPSESREGSKVIPGSRSSSKGSCEAVVAEISERGSSKDLPMPPFASETYCGHQLEETPRLDDVGDESETKQQFTIETPRDQLEETPRLDDVGDEREEKQAAFPTVAMPWSSPGTTDTELHTDRHPAVMETRAAEAEKRVAKLEILFESRRWAIMDP